MMLPGVASEHSGDWPQIPGGVAVMHSGDKSGLLGFAVHRAGQDTAPTGRHVCLDFVAPGAGRREIGPLPYIDRRLTAWL